MNTFIMVTVILTFAVLCTIAYRTKNVDSPVIIVKDPMQATVEFSDGTTLSVPIRQGIYQDVDDILAQIYMEIPELTQSK